VNADPDPGDQSNADQDTNLDSKHRLRMRIRITDPKIIFLTIETCSWNHKEQEKREFLFAFLFLCRIQDNFFFLSGLRQKNAAKKLNFLSNVYSVKTKI
jgi:hypothetical protein